MHRPMQLAARACERLALDPLPRARRRRGTVRVHGSSSSCATAPGAPTPRGHSLCSAQRITVLGDLPSWRATLLPQGAAPELRVRVSDRGYAVDGVDVRAVLVVCADGRRLCGY